MATPSPISEPRPPRQDRSRRTLARILGATERLLAKKPFEAITIGEIVRAARTSTGSLYSRIGTREGLLPLLYERYDARLHVTVNPILDGIESRELGLEELARVVVRTTLQQFVSQRWLVRAIGLHIRTHPESLSPERRERRRDLHERIVSLFDRHADLIGGADPRERVRLGLYFASAVLRDKLLFGAAPHAQSTPLDDADLEDEVTRMLLAYLASPAEDTPPRRSRRKRP